MSNLGIIAEDREAVEGVCRGLAGIGHTCSIIADVKEVINAEARPDLVLLEGGYARMKELSRMIKSETDLPIIALFRSRMLNGIDDLKWVDDFVIEPWSPKELELRVGRLLRRTAQAEGEIIRCGDLVVNASQYEVFVAGRPIALTFKEYELLKFLVTNKGRVFTRETLLNKVWGYDYYGGDRTVDVHIKRLRSKIEGSRHVIIETVRNIGYRLRVNSQPFADS